MSMEEENKALVYSFWKELTKGNLEVWNELCAPEYVYHGTAGDSTLEQAKELGLINYEQYNYKVEYYNEKAMKWVNKIFAT